MVNTSIDGTSVTRHRSSSQISKEKEVAGIISDNQINLITKLKFFQICWDHFFPSEL
jgi:hypothetical protein